MNLSPVSSAYTSPVDFFASNYDDEDARSNSTFDEPNRNGDQSRCPSDDTDDSCAATYNYVLPTFKRRNDYDDFRDINEVLLRCFFFLPALVRDRYCYYINIYLGSAELTMYDTC